MESPSIYVSIGVWYKSGAASAWRHMNGMTSQITVDLLCVQQLVQVANNKENLKDPHYRTFIRGASVDSTFQRPLNAVTS